MKIDDVAREADWNNTASIEEAMAKMQHVADPELRMRAALYDTMPDSGGRNGVEVGLVRAEVARRDVKAEKQTSFLITILATALGILGGLLGVLLGFWLDRPPISAVSPPASLTSPDQPIDTH